MRSARCVTNGMSKSLVCVDASLMLKPTPRAVCVAIIIRRGEATGRRAPAMRVMSLISIVLPVHNESGNIGPLLEAIRGETAGTGDEYEILFIDDGSDDGSWDKILEASKRYPNVRAIRLSRNFGKEAAIAAGLEAASGDAVIVMDADLQHPPSLIPHMVMRWKEGTAEVVEAVRTCRGDEAVHSRVGSRVFYAIMNHLTGFSLKDASDFKLMDGRVVAAWRRLGEKSLFFRGLCIWLGFRRAQISFETGKRRDGCSKWTTGSLIKLALTGITSFSSIPLQLVTLMGCIFFIFAVILGIRAVMLKFTGIVIDGFTTLILLHLITGSMIMISLGIIGKYIACIYDEVKGRPRYIVRESIGPENASVRNRKPEPGVAVE